MKIFIMVDMEGISGIVRPSQVTPGSDDYPAGRKLLTADVNVAVDGCFQGGASEVVVRDAHGGGMHFIYERLDSRARYIQGASPVRMPGIESCDGLILLGYHAMAGTPAAVLEHTMSSKHWQNFYINGEKAGEIAIDAGIAADHDVPTIMVSGDDKACGEAAALLPGVVTAEVKQGLAVDGAILLSQEKAHELIREGAAQAVKQCKDIKPKKVASPVTMKLEVVSRGGLPLKNKNATILDGRTFETTADTVEGTLNQL